MPECAKESVAYAIMWEVTGEKASACRKGARAKGGKSEKCPWQARMSQGMNGLAGYVAGGRRDNWDS